MDVRRAPAREAHETMNETAVLRGARKASASSTRTSAIFAAPRPFPQPRPGAASL